MAIAEAPRLVGVPPLVSDDDFKKLRRNQLPGWWAGSYTSLTDYANCPALYKFKRESGFVPGGEAAQLGQAVHAEAAGGKGAPPVNKIRAFQELVSKCRVFPVPDNAITERELFIEWQINDDLRAQIRAFVDVLWWVDEDSGIAYHMDRKTGKWNNEHIREKWGAQRDLYGLAIARNTNAWKTVGWTHHVPSDTVYPCPEGDQKDVGDLEEYAVTLEAIVEKIALDKAFHPNPGNACRICDFSAECPAAKERLSDWELEITTKDGKVTAIKIPESLKFDENYLKDLSGALPVLRKFVKDGEETLRLARQDKEG